MRDSGRISDTEWYADLQADAWHRMLSALRCTPRAVVQTVSPGAWLRGRPLSKSLLWAGGGIALFSGLLLALRRPWLSLRRGTVTVADAVHADVAHVQSPWRPMSAWLATEVIGLALRAIRSSTARAARRMRRRMQRSDKPIDIHAPRDSRLK